MLSESDPNFQAISAMLREFSDAMGFHGLPKVTRIFTSPVLPLERQVLRVALGNDLYAMKIDFTSDVTARLAKEFDGLKQLNAHFQTYEKLGTATPIYLSKAGTFFAMDFLAFLTAGQRLQQSQQLQTTRQVYRRAGLWLTAMHEFKEPKQGKFDGKWMVHEINARIEDGQMEAPLANVERMRDILREEIVDVHHTKSTRAWSHGDFHSENIMMAPGMTYAFDLTEARMKMALYDTVDFLKVDIYRQVPGEEIDRSGIIAKHREMFFKGYKHAIKPKLFDVAMRGRLLIDWASIERSSYAKNESQQLQFLRLKQRLDIAFKA
ncbi:phosphotransferase [Octadecabacter ascidiaceicola]|uniref:Phosphotransferase enzyme family protein n=1 Tax=Octadecabacter ascidiaceicola TaxID=1655543 RepID=A0A238K8B1_9RHOB|nr:phosphotransferase [Octadecabacter ascidiaceicola]SMX39045.1 Phosphotransferase enzyme family protein [Octadecabacter ascidiaceicola]